MLQIKNITTFGWIKGVNSNTLVATRDMGEDGRIDGANITASDLNGGVVLTGKINNLVAQDVFGYTLGYYENDYHSISPSTFDAVGHASSPLNSSTTDLFNGNISNWVMAMENTSEARLKTFGKLFAYDQLNRVKTSDVYNDVSGSTDNVLNNNSFAGAGAAFDYHEDFNYDPNGNILEANRNGNFIGGSNPMDNLTYYYKLSGGGTYQWSYNTSTHLNDLPSDATNQLDHVDETASGTGSYSGDVEDQLVTNYTYDAIGNLESDLQEEIANIERTVFGKIRKITRTGTSDKPDLEFRYNAMGNRICKIVKPKDPGTHLVLDQRDWTYTYYTHDASGNVMAVYDRDLSDNGGNVDDKITLKEQDLYASSRVGLKRPLNDDGSAIVISGFTFTPGTPGGDGIIPVSATVGSISGSNLPSGMRWMTRKQYELSNHLGNVYAVVSDKKIGNANSLSTTAVAYYTADVISATDYFAFGAPENGREFSSTDYRYGFNGKENDPETVGTGEGMQDYGMRIYNPGLGRFLSVDPLRTDYPELTPYQFASNKPIEAIDLDGLECLDNPFVMQQYYYQQFKYAEEHGQNSYLAVKQATKMICTSTLTGAAIGLSVVGVGAGVYYLTAYGLASETMVGAAYTITNAAIKTGNLIKYYAPTAIAGIKLVAEFYGADPVAPPTGVNQVSNSVNRFLGSLVASVDESKKVLNFRFNWSGPRLDGQASTLTGLANLRSDGLIEFAFEVPQEIKGQGVGATMFKYSMEYYGNSIRGVAAKWVEAMPDNLNTFNSLIKSGLSAEVAATKTFTGVQASQYGFTQAIIDYTKSVMNSDGTFKSVELKFINPGQQ